MAPRRRDALRPYLNRWVTFTAHVADVSATYQLHPTLLLRHVYDTKGNFITGHVWIAVALEGVCVGDSIAFQGHVSSYQKGWRGGRAFGQKKQLDYRIDSIKNVRVLTHER